MRIAAMSDGFCMDTEELGHLPNRQISRREQTGAPFASRQNRDDTTDGYGYIEDSAGGILRRRPLPTHRRSICRSTIADRTPKTFDRFKFRRRETTVRSDHADPGPTGSVMRHCGAVEDIIQHQMRPTRDSSCPQNPAGLPLW